MAWHRWAKGQPGPGLAPGSQPPHETRQAWDRGAGRLEKELAVVVTAAEHEPRCAQVARWQWHLVFTSHGVAGRSSDTILALRLTWVRFPPGALHPAWSYSVQ